MTRVTTRKGYCPSCESEQELERVRRRETVSVRGEKIQVQASYWRCRACGEEFEGPDGHDEVAQAYKLYRAKKGLMQPEEIKQLRDAYGLTQGELAKILGFGAVTLSRYETGMLQTAAQDRILQMLRDPRAFWSLLKQAGDAGDVPPATLARVREKVKEGMRDRAPLDPAIQAALDYGPSRLSGSRRFHLEKFRNAVLFFCQTFRWKTTINKLLFYADFRCFRDHQHSITGARYAHAPFGPCPDKFESLFAWLAERKDIDVSEVTIARNCTGEQIRSVAPPEEGVFTGRELQILVDVRNHFGRMTAKALSDLSHKEQAYRETQSGELISYRYAQSLKIQSRP
jgi:putative zinc finger/helix-turn-helix YgiT family protein